MLDIRRPKFYPHTTFTTMLTPQHVSTVQIVSFPDTGNSNVEFERESIVYVYKTLHTHRILCFWHTSPHRVATWYYLIKELSKNDDYCIVTEEYLEVLREAELLHRFPEDVNFSSIRTSHRNTALPASHGTVMTHGHAPLATPTLDRYTPLCL